VKTNDPATAEFVIVLLKAAEADDTLRGYDDLAALLGAAGNTEADFTGYTRISVTDAELLALPAPDDANDRYDVDMPDVEWDPAGGATNNSLVKLVIGYNETGGADSGILPVGHYDFVATTDGNKLTAEVAAGGFYRAS